jgi:uncharacterized coiled-coil DUF342 family protein
MDFFTNAISSLDPSFAKKNEDYRNQIEQNEAQLQLVRKKEQELLREVKILNQEVTRARQALWEAQDKIDESKGKINEMKHHVDDLLQQRVDDDRTIHMLKEENMKLVEGELKIRESLDLMKTVFTRAQIKTKEDQETIARLRQERDAMRKEVKKLLEQPEKSNNKSFSLLREFSDSGNMMNVTTAASGKEKTLKKLLLQTERDYDALKKHHVQANKTIKRLRQQMDAMNDPAEASRQLDKQSRIIDKLEQQIIDMQLEDADREDRELRDDDAKFGLTDNVVNRAFLDEDLEDSLAQQVFAKLDCASGQ